MTKKEERRDSWLSKLADEAKAHKTWRKRAKEADDAFCAYDDKENGPLYPIFSQTVNIIHGRIYGQPPKPDVRKRHPSGPRDQAQPQQTGPVNPGMPGAAPGMPPAPGDAQQPQPQGAAPAPQDASADDNTIAMCLERAIAYTIDTTLFDRDAHMAVNDFLISGCGIAKIEVETEIDQIPVLDPVTNQPLLDEDGQPLQQAQITSQELHLRHFHWSQFRWEPCKDWRQCSWISFDHYMTRDDVEDEFGVDLGNVSGGSGGFVGNEDQTPGTKLPERDKYKDVFTVHEIWDKRRKKRLWVTEAYPAVLDEQDDPLELDNFFPCPAPMMANVSGKELLPSPDYFQYESLCKQVNDVSWRIAEITRQVKDIAFYDQAFGELKRANDYPDGSFIPVNNLLDKLRHAGGSANTDSVICQLDMTSKVNVLKELLQQRDILKATIYEINGIADIQRGSSNPDETATAQRIKNQWADIRTGQRVQVVALFFRDVFRIMSNLIAQKFQPDQIMAMSGIVLTDNQLATMRSGLASSYAIDVESDSTMAQNDSVAQEQLTQFMQVLTPYLQQMLPAVQSGTLPADIAKEIFLSIKDTFKGGRQLEQAINQLPDTLQQLQGLTQQAQQAQQQAQQAQQETQQASQQAQDLQQQLEQCQQQLQDAQSQLNDREQQRKDVTTQADVGQKAAQTQKTQADAAIAQANAMKAGAEARQALRQNVIESRITGVQ